MGRNGAAVSAIDRSNLPDKLHKVPKSTRKSEEGISLLTGSAVSALTHVAQGFAISTTFFNIVEVFTSEPNTGRYAGRFIGGKLPGAFPRDVAGSRLMISRRPVSRFPEERQYR